MTRQDYIHHLDTLRKGVLELMKFDAEKKATDGDISKPTELELDRAKKTQKMFEDLSVRLYEDGAVFERVRIEKLLKGDVEQAEMTFPKESKRKGGAK